VKQIAGRTKEVGGCMKEVGGGMKQVGGCMSVQPKPQARIHYYNGYTPFGFLPKHAYGGRIHVHCCCKHLWMYFACAQEDWAVNV
jgi:hypothetical protein